ncbi:MAG TPA: DNA-directed RNA polymerase subunit alpha C-terminal domain-containing protein [Phycisphaerae bacterium]|nr:DNA-directed RNA polymerase subunit alpha C-terminal domain-containing protein [Phycisphaerae bacterium]
MQQSSQEALQALCEKESWTVEDHAEAVKAVVATPDAANRFRALVGRIEAAHPDPKGAAAVKVGIARYLVCRFQAAIEALAQGTDNRDRRYFQGLCHQQLRQHDKAVAEFERAKDRGWEGPECDIRIVESLALGGQLDEAARRLGQIEKRLAGSADPLYLRGLIDELNGYAERACEAYEKARKLDANHSAATFRLAFHYDLHGSEDEAIELYKQCAARPPIHANALLNLAVLYEDKGDYDRAAACLRRILAINPTHPRARLFLRDVESAKTMYYDEDQARRIAKRNAVLDIPVTDFELSVRARNCLKKMNIRTLGDLVRTTESDLLAYKNFGETSLKEIKDMLSAKGLRLGQALEDGSELADLATPRQVQVSNEGVLATPIEHVEFSIRARRALDTLKLRTLGELITKTDADLLACKNFGQTSLNEIRQRLAEYGFRLREPN